MKQISDNADGVSRSIIRKTTESDLDGIRDLYGENHSDSSAIRRRKNQPWEWLLMDNDMNNSFRSVVALDDNKVIGHIGYIRSYYHFSGKRYVGVHPLAWNVEEKHRGLLGLSLFSNTMKECDFNLMAGGTERAQKIYRALNFNIVTYGKRFTKVLKPIKYYKILSGSVSIRIARTLIHSRGLLKKSRISSRKGSDETEVKATDIHKFEYEVDESVMANIPEEKYIDWILNCPVVNTYLFSISAEGKPCGFAICYTQKTDNDILVGRIVHISNLGSEPKIWRQVIHHLEKFFRTEGCAIISTLATYPVFIRALNQSGYIFRTESGIWIKGKLPDIPQDSWHLTYLEGDLGYRGLF